MTARKEKSTQKSSEAKGPECDAASDLASNRASERFVKDLEVRGEAVKPAESGKLPADATHVVVEENPDGTAKKVERARFKMF